MLANRSSIPYYISRFCKCWQSTAQFLRQAIRQPVRHPVQSANSLLHIKIPYYISKFCKCWQSEAQFLDSGNPRSNSSIHSQKRPGRQPRKQPVRHPGPAPIRHRSGTDPAPLRHPATAPDPAPDPAVAGVPCGRLGLFYHH